MEKQLFGKRKNGDEVYKYTLENKCGTKMTVLDFGAVLQSLVISDKLGGFRDVVLGFDNLSDYEKNDCFLGAFLGPNANRIGDASCSIDGVKLKLEKNDGDNNLHSHKELGYHNRLFKCISFEEMQDIYKKYGKELIEGKFYSEHILNNHGEYVIFYLRDEEETGFPGNKDVFVIYVLNDKNELVIEYRIFSDQNTIINPTNHSYFNLDGHDSGDATKQHLKMYSHKITPIDDKLIPTGEIMDISGTVLDFRQRKTIAKDLALLDSCTGGNDDKAIEQMIYATGYDHNYIIDESSDDAKSAEQMFEYFYSSDIVKKSEFNLNKAAELISSNWKIRMQVLTDRPAMQFYSGNFLNGLKGKEGAIYDKRSGVCFETQGYPDAPNHDNFPSSKLRKGEEFKSTSIYRFL